MGAYLSAPITEKESGEGGNDLYDFGVCAMQGWRTDMEDAHMVALNIDANDSQGPHPTALFGVFDGHGGKEVAKFAAAHLPAVVRSLESYRTGDLSTALAQSFLKVDELLVKDENEEELKSLKGSDGDGGGGERGGGGEGSAMTISSSQLPESLLEMLGMPGDNSVVFKIVKGANGQMHIDDFTGGEEEEGAGGSSSSDDDDDDDDEGTIAEDAGDAAAVTTSADGVAAITTASGTDTTTDGAAAVVDVIDGGAAAGNRKRKADAGGGPMQLDGADDEQGALGSPREVEIEDIGGAPRGEEDSEWHGPTAGCTAVCAAVRGDQLIVANAGDSRCVLSRSGRAVALTQDHKPTDPEEYARITKAGGFVADGRVNGSLNLSRALGDLEYKQTKELPVEQQMVTAAPEMRSETLRPSEDEFLILACDGIWDILTNQQAVDFVRQRLLAGKTPREICEECCDHCLAPDTNGCGKGCDNMSIVVVVLKGSELAKQAEAARRERAAAQQRKQQQ